MAGDRRGSQRDGSHEKDLMEHYWLEDGGGEKECKWNPGAKNGPQLTASKDEGISNLQIQELDFSKNLNEHGNGCFPRAPT